MLLSHFRVMNSLKKKSNQLKFSNLQMCQLASAFHFIVWRAVQKSQLLISSPVGPPCRGQPLAVICQPESLEKILVSYFTQAHPRVIDFSFSECKIDFLSFIPVRTSWQTVARNLMEAFVKRSLSQDALLSTGKDKHAMYGGRRDGSQSHV